MILTPTGLYLVEIKSRPGTVTGDAHRRGPGRPTAATSGVGKPLLLANRKAKRLKSLTHRPVSDREGARADALHRAADLPVSDEPALQARWPDALRQPFGPAGATFPGILGVLTNVSASAAGQLLVGHEQTRAIARAIIEAGIRPSNKHRQVGDYRLGKLLIESESFQEFEPERVSIAAIHGAHLQPCQGGKPGSARVARAAGAARVPGVKGSTTPAS